MESQDKLKLVGALLCVVAECGGFYLIPEGQGVLRVLAVLAGKVPRPVAWCGCLSRARILCCTHKTLSLKPKSRQWPTRKKPRK